MCRGDPRSRGVGPGCVPRRPPLGWVRSSVRALPAVGSSSSLSSAGSARHLVPGACSEAAPEALAPGHCCSFADPVTANLEGAVTFEAPDLPEETLMEVRRGRRPEARRCPSTAGARVPLGCRVLAPRRGRAGAEASRPVAPWSTPVPGPKVSSCFSQQEHTEILHSLRFTLVFVQHVLEIAALKGSASETAGGPEYQLQESVVADQISLLSREWGWVCPAGLVGRWPGCGASEPPDTPPAPQLCRAAGALPEGGRAAVLWPADCHRPDSGWQALPVVHGEAG